MSHNHPKRNTMTNPLTPARRKWLYRVSIAAIPLGIAFGWLDAKTAALIPPLLVALLNVNED